MSNLHNENSNWHDWLEKPVCAKGTFFGTLKYFGPTKFSDGLWCGIELDKPIGKNNGMINNIEYFSCLPKYGIFVPVSKVNRIEKSLDNLECTLLPQNETFELKNCFINVPQSNSEAMLVDSNKINSDFEINKDKPLNPRRESEESLGILDFSLIENSLDSWDSLALDEAIDETTSKLKGSLSNINNQEPLVIHPFLQVSSLSEISQPKYASTPRNPIKRRSIGPINTAGLHLTLKEDAEEYDDVFENQISFQKEIFFDNDKLKNNPNLTSTTVLNNVDALTTSIANLSPIENDKRISPNSDLNKTKIVSFPLFSSDQDLPLSIDPNKTQTLHDGFEKLPNIEALSTTFEVKNLNSTVILYSNQSEKVEVIENNPTDKTMCVNKDLNSTFDLNAAVKKLPSCNSASDNEMEKCVVGNENSLLLKTFVLETSSSKEKGNELFPVDNSITNMADSKPLSLNTILEKEANVGESFSKMAVDQEVAVPIKSTNTIENEPPNAADNCFANTADSKPLNLNNTFSEEKANREISLSKLTIEQSVAVSIKPTNSLKSCSSTNLNSTFQKNKIISNNSKLTGNQKSSSYISKLNNPNKKQIEFKKPLNVYSMRKPLKPLSVTDVKEKENKDLLSSKTKVNDSSAETKSSKVSYNKLNISLKSESKLKEQILSGNKAEVSRRFSYSLPAESIELRKSASSLPKTKNNSESSFINRSKTQSCTVRNLPDNNLNCIKDCSNVSVNCVEKSTSNIKATDQKNVSKKSSISLIKRPVSNNFKNKLPVSRQSLGYSSIPSKECRMPRRNSLAPSSKPSVPIGIIKPRYSTLYPVKEMNSSKLEKTVPLVKPLSKTDNQTISEEKTVNYLPSASSSNISRRLSSIPQKNVIADSRKLGEKYSDVKEESGARPKIPRYDLRRRN